MPRINTGVKGIVKTKVNNVELDSLGAVDIHFHGAFGIDVMTADDAALHRLSRELWKRGVAAFCPTTVSTTYPELKAAVTRIGQWIKRTQADKKTAGARPLGIHLEGPYIHTHACGAHPKNAIRAYAFVEIQDLWEASSGTLKILTIAPELLSPTELRELSRWARKHAVILSLGHSRATEAQAQAAFGAGISNVTHAWNALPFHHRSPGPLGAALGRPGVFIELIIDEIHVSPTLLRWTRKLHPADQLCFVSDCAPAADTRSESWHAFGPLQITFKDGAARLPDGGLAGGGHLLPKMFANWARREARTTRQPLASVVRQSLPSLNLAPLKALRISPQTLKDRRVRWTVRGQTLTVKPLQ